jgi:hypothetical protein
MVATSRYTREHQDRHPSPVDNLLAFDSVVLPACSQQTAESGHSLFGSQPSYDIRNDPSSANLYSGLAGDKQKFFQPMMALPMDLVERTPEDVLG